ncbi:MAG: response regulator [Anaerovoracaceae bacterium]|jgi:YesN/AraC family two-component response regulator
MKKPAGGINMIRVLIVDDEERQRNGLIRHVNWERYRMVITGEAESAQQALELAAENPPDLLITDIRLIGTDGLELSIMHIIIHPWLLSKTI